VAGSGSLRADLEDAKAKRFRAWGRATYIQARLLKWQHHEHDNDALVAVEDLIEALEEVDRALTRAYGRSNVKMQGGTE